MRRMLRPMVWWQLEKEWPSIDILLSTFTIEHLSLLVLVCFLFMFFVYRKTSPTMKLQRMKAKKAKRAKCAKCASGIIIAAPYKRNKKKKIRSWTSPHGVGEVLRPVFYLGGIAGVDSAIRSCYS